MKALGLALAALLALAIPSFSYAQTPGYVSPWTYAPPTGGLLNTTTAVTITPAKGTYNANYLSGGECYVEPLTNATELVIRDGAGGTVLWRMKIPTGGWPNPVDINILPAIRATPNNLLEMATLTASGTGAVYCNWRGSVGG
jgi:hypothetical protein